jgi:hypothetical protein
LFANLAISFCKNSPFNEENPIIFCLRLELLIKPEIVPPVPTEVQIKSNSESASVKISSHPFIANLLVPPSGIK